MSIKLNDEISSVSLDNDKIGTVYEKLLYDNRDRDHAIGDLTALVNKSLLQITLHQRFPGKLRERCHNVERKLWKCCLLTLLQRNPGTLLKC